MTREQDLHAQFQRAWAQHRFHFEDKLYHAGWYHAWKPESYTKHVRGRESDWEQRHPKLSDNEKQKLIAFIATSLINADPTPHKIYAPTLFRWMRFGLNFDELPNVTKKLSDYHEAVSSGHNLTTAPYVSRKKTGDPRVAPKPLKKNPMDAFNDYYAFIRFFENEPYRAEKAENFSQGPEMPVQKGSALVHASAHFHLYRNEDNFDEDFSLTLPSGHTYALSTFNGLHAESNRRDKCLFDRILHDTPGLAQVLFAEIIEHNKTAHKYNKTAPLDFLFLSPTLPYTKDFSLGSLTNEFQAKYEKKINAPRPNQDEPAEYTSEFDAEEKQKIESKRNACPFFNLYNDLHTLTRYKQECAAVKPDFIKQVFNAAVKAGAAGSARHALDIIATIPAWRSVITATDINPIFSSLTQPRRYSNESANDRKQLVNLMVTIAKTPTAHWRDGSEAIHLPAVIDQILKNKDWARLKVILHRASRPDDKVSKMWRDGIPRATRTAITDNRFDNAYKAHYIDHLMQRMEMVDKGDTALFRLRDMPSTAQDIASVRTRDTRIRQARHALKAKAALAVG